MEDRYRLIAIGSMLRARSSSLVERRLLRAQVPEVYREVGEAAVQDLIRSLSVDIAELRESNSAESKDSLELLLDDVASLRYSLAAVRLASYDLGQEVLYPLIWMLAELRAIAER